MVTYNKIEEEIKANTGKDINLFRQIEKGKADAVRLDLRKLR